jgi:hypothetical protein
MPRNRGLLRIRIQRRSARHVLHGRHQARIGAAGLAIDAFFPGGSPNAFSSRQPRASRQAIPEPACPL